MKQKLLTFCMLLVMLLTTNSIQVFASTTTNVEYQTHVQTYGWQKYVKNGTSAGTTGKSKRLEGIRYQRNL